MGISIPLVTAGISGAAALFGGPSNSNQPPPPPPSYQPQNLPGADAGAFGAIGQLPGYNSAGQSLGQYGNITQNLINNPYAGGFQGNANNISPYAMGAGSNLVGAGQSYLPYAQQALQAGFDPMNSVYNQQFQQNTDATRAGLAARGIAMSPYGAGVENQSNLNFNNQWLQNMLQRQQTAAGTAGSLTGAAGSATTTGLNTLLQGAQLPYATANTIGTNQQGALGQYGQFGNLATTTAQPQIADYLQYLGYGNQAAGVQNQAYANQLTANNQQFNQQQTLGKNLGTSISGLGTAFNQFPFGSSGISSGKGGV